MRETLGLLAEVAATRVRVEWLLRRKPLDACVRALDRPSIPASDADPERVGHVTERWLRNRRLPRTTCLQRALARYAMLRARGVDVAFVLGLGTDGLEGHAWVVVDGSPWFERDVDGLVPTYRHPPPPK